MTFLRAITILIAEEPSNSTLRQGRVKWRSFWVLLVIISLPTPTFHCMFTWPPSLLCISCAGGTKRERQWHPEQVEPCTDCPFTSEISVKREHGILIPVMRYFYFLIFVRRPPPSPPFTPLLVVSLCGTQNADSVLGSLSIVCLFYQLQLQLQLYFIRLLVTIDWPAK